ncbi:hypothetical protein RIF29_15066 [Crotalaria pallida]|uniref:Uncharacterized protein n=1 Tax=Crotalaria pallida TaxID=3830 RepID=A0AAN9ICA2_CROPI
MIEEDAGHLEDWALCYGGGSSSTRTCGDSSLLEDEELDDIGASDEEVDQDLFPWSLLRMSRSWTSSQIVHESLIEEEREGSSSQAAPPPSVPSGDEICEEPIQQKALHEEGEDQEETIADH